MTVIKFPRTPEAQFMEAEAYIRTEMRMQLAAACGTLGQPVNKTELADVLDRITKVAELVSHYVAITEACK